MSAVSETPGQEMWRRLIGECWPKSPKYLRV
jgi:hypothetical protein